MTVAVAGGVAGSRIDTGALLRECGLTALVVLALGVTLVGFRVADVPGGLDILTRFDDVAVAVVYAFFGRMALVLLRWGVPLPVLAGAGAFSLVSLVLLFAETLTGLFGAPAVGADMKRVLPFDDVIVSWMVLGVALVFTIRAWRMWRSGSVTAGQGDADRLALAVHRASIYIGPLLLAFAVALPFLWFADRQVVDIATLVVMYIMLGWGLNIVVGYAGLLDLGYVAFYAVGAYAYALLAQEMGMGFWVCLPFAGAMAATAGLLLGFPVLRVRGDYLAIVTLRVRVIFRIAGRRIDCLRASIATRLRAIQSSPNMCSCSGFPQRPAVPLGVLDCSTNVFVGMIGHRTPFTLGASMQLQL